MTNDEQIPENGDDVADADLSDRATSGSTEQSEPTGSHGETGDVTPSDDEPVTSPRRPVRPAASAASRARRIGGSAVRATPAVGAAEPTADRRDVDSSVDRGSKPTRTPVNTEKKPSTRAVPDAVDAGSTRSRFGRQRSNVESTSTAAGKAPSGGPRQRDSRAALRWMPAGILSAAAVAMVVVLIVVITGGRWDRPAASTVRDQVLSAAKTCLVATNTYKYTALDAFEKKGLACSSSASAAEFKQSVDKLLKKIAPTVKQSQTFQVNSAGIIDVTADNQWDVLVYGQLSVVNVSTKGRVDPYGAQVRMQKVGGQWRMVRLDTLCSSSLITSGNKCT